MPPILDSSFFEINTGLQMKKRYYDSIQEAFDDLTKILNGGQVLRTASNDFHNKSRIATFASNPLRFKDFVQVLHL